MTNKRLLLVLIFFAFCAPAVAKEPLSAAQEKRAQQLFTQLHCVVCSGQSLAGSDAQIAHHIRGLVRTKIAAGEPDQAILDYLVARYGEAVLMAPPVRASTLPLWLAPIALLCIAALIAWRGLFRTSSTGAPQ